MKSKYHKDWPVLKYYDSQHLRRVALPLGGIGTGTVSLGGRGDLRDWEIVNQPIKGFKPAYAFFALYAKPANSNVVTRALEGAIDPEDYEGASGCTIPNHSLPHFQNCSFAAAYPFGQVLLSDPVLPVEVRIEAFNPLIPGDSENSGIPVAVLRYVLINKTNKAVDATVCGSMENFIGKDGISGNPKNNVNIFRSGSNPKLQGIFMKSEGVDPHSEQFGTMALTTIKATGISYRTAWPSYSYGNTLLDFWDDLGDDGRLDERELPQGVDNSISSLAVSLNIPSKSTTSVTFLLTWHFPNRMTWTPQSKDQNQSSCCEDSKCCEDNPDRIGNYYTTKYQDAWDVAVKTSLVLPELEADTVKFVRAFCEADLPVVVKEAALFNLSTLRSQTCFRTEDGRFYGWEGCNDKGGCCDGSCTHVWNYEQATAFLFGELAKKMREVEFLHATDDQGLMSFRVKLPISHASEWKFAAADGQSGCFMKLYRDWQLSGDDEILRSLWDKVKKALEFYWIPGSWDADRDGVMEGCQHNTMDAEYYGPNPQMGAWYLGALRAVEEMARYLGDTEFAATCRNLFENGSRWMDQNLFNGEYYEHEIRPPVDESAIAPGLRIGAGAKNLADPELQLGAGCLVDQLVGQYMSHICGLGYLLDKKHVRTTLRSIFKYNFKQNLYGHFNHLRSFALNEESAILMATYPKGRRPRQPFLCYNEVMTGFEYTAAVGMLYEGQIEEGLKVIQAIRNRYDGRKRSPFDEAECGHHYARAMSSWASILALTGFKYSGVEKSMTFTARDGVYFWSNGYAWGTCKQGTVNKEVKVKLTVLHGSLNLKRFELTGVGCVDFSTQKNVGTGKSLSLGLKISGK